MSQAITMNPIGLVRNDCTDPAQAMRMQDAESIIEVDETFADALYMIDSCEYLDVVFHFHLPEAGKGAEKDLGTGEKMGYGAEQGPETGTEHGATTGTDPKTGSGVDPEATHGWRRTTKTGEMRGVFASRSPVRPNRIGITTVRLVSRDGNRLRVTGLDAVDGTPVLDIKSCNTSHLDDVPCGAADPIHTSLLKSNPRLTIQKHIMAGDTEKLLMMAAQFHGHYCPGLAMGVMAAVHAMRQLDRDNGSDNASVSGTQQRGSDNASVSGTQQRGSDNADPGQPHSRPTPEGHSNPDQTDGSQSTTASDGLEDLLAIVETNNCFADGVQLVTGCSFGNNSLIFEDLGKTAFTLTRRDGNGVRVISRHESPAYVRESFPEFDRHYQRVVRDQVRDEATVAAFRKSGVERSFGTLGLDFDRMFEVQRVRVDVPDYAPSHESGVCAKCGDSVMATRMVDAGDASTKGPDKTTWKPDSAETTAGSGKLCLKCAGKPYRVLDGHGIRTAGHRKTET